MVNINCNGRNLSITFRYNGTYNLDIPDPTFNTRLKTALIGVTAEERDQLKATFRRNNPRFMRVQRKLTIVELHEGRGKDSKLIARLERKLNHKDKPFHRKSPEAEALRRDMIKVLFQGATQAGILSKLERKCFWDAINTRYGKRPNPLKVTPPEGSTPVAAKVGRPIEVVDAVAPNADTIKPALRLVVGRRIEAKSEPHVASSGGGHSVVNKMVASSNTSSYPAGFWHPLMTLQAMPGETIH